MVPRAEGVQAREGADARDLRRAHPRIVQNTRRAATWGAAETAALHTASRPAVTIFRCPARYADAARDILNRDFVVKARAVGQPVIWKSFPNHPHDVPPRSVWLFGTCAESAHRFTNAAVTVVSPPEFCILPPGTQVVR